MTGYLYRRPENSNAADACEKVGRFLMCGWDIASTDLITYNDQKVITEFNPERSLLGKVASTTWNVAKMIFMPLGIMGFVFLECSSSYARFTASIDTFGISTKDEVTQQIWSDLHGTAPYNSEIVGGRHIADYANDARKEFVSKLLNVPSKDVVIDQETGEAKATIQKPDFKCKITYTVQNIPVNISEAAIRPLELLENVESKFFENQLGRFTHLVRKPETKEEENKVIAEVMQNPHRIVILCDKNSYKNKTVRLFSVDSENKPSYMEVVNPTPERLQSEFNKFYHNTKYAAEANLAREQLAVIIDVKRMLLANEQEKYPGITVNENTYQYEFTHEQIKLCYPLATELDKLPDLIDADIGKIPEESRNAASSSTSQPTLMSIPFLSLKPTAVRSGTQCGVDNLIDKIMNLNNQIPEENDKKLFYKVQVDNLRRMLWYRSNENWRSLATLLNRPATSEDLGFSVFDFMEFLDSIAGKGVDGVLYELHRLKIARQQKETSSFKDVLLQQKDQAIDRFVKRNALKFLCDEERIRRELVRLGVGIDYPAIQRPMDPLPGVNLIELQNYLTVEQLLPPEMMIPFQETDLADLRKVTDKRCFTVQPYSDAIKDAKAALKNKNQEQYNSEQWHPRFDQELVAIKDFANYTPEAYPNLDTRVIKMIQQLRNDVATLKTEKSNRVLDAKEMAEYLDGKEQLLAAAVKKHRFTMEIEKESVKKGGLSDQFYNDLTIRMLTEQGHVVDGYYTREFISLYLANFD